MRLTKYTHACVRLERDGRALVIDPGVFSERDACDGASAVLVTHEHPDHVNMELLPRIVEQNPGLKIYAGEAVTSQLSALGDAVVTVSLGDLFDAGGFAVQAVGGQHAEVYDGLPGIANLGYIVDAEVYHPGDSFFIPLGRMPALLLPVGGPWVKTAEMLDFVRAVAPERAFPIHDAVLSPIGFNLVDGWVAGKGQTNYERIPVGGSVEI